MNLEELIAQFRVDADDGVSPYFFGDATVTGWLNEAEDEAALRARLIHESVDATICSIAVTADTATYSLHDSLYEITHLAFKATGESDWETLKLVSTEWLDANVRDWRDESDTPKYAVQGETSLRLVPNPDEGGALRLEGYRLPKTAMDLEEDAPEIHKAHHRHLVHWALHKAFSVPDSEKFDPERSAKADYEFTRYFGLRPDSDLRRMTREDVPHTVRPDW